MLNFLVYYHIMLKYITLTSKIIQKALLLYLEINTNVCLLSV